MTPVMATKLNSMAQVGFLPKHNFCYDIKTQRPCEILDNSVLVFGNKRIPIDEDVLKRYDLWFMWERQDSTPLA